MCRWRGTEDQMRAQKYYKRKCIIFEMSSEDGLIAFLCFYFKMKLVLYLLYLNEFRLHRNEYMTRTVFGRSFVFVEFKFVSPLDTCLDAPEIFHDLVSAAVT